MVAGEGFEPSKVWGFTVPWTVVFNLYGLKGPYWPKIESRYLW